MTRIGNYYNYYYVTCQGICQRHENQNRYHKKPQNLLKGSASLIFFRVFSLVLVNYYNYVTYNLALNLKVICLYIKYKKKKYFLNSAAICFTIC